MSLSQKPDIHKHTCTSLFDNAVCVIVAATSQSGTASCEAMKNCKYSGYFGQHQIIMFSLVVSLKTSPHTSVPEIPSDSRESELLNL